MKVSISNAEGLIATSTINIYGQKLHQLGQILFNSRDDNSAEYLELLKEMEDVCHNIKERTIAIIAKIEERNR